MVAREDYLRCYSDYVLNITYRAMLHLRIAETTISFPVDFRDYGFDNNTGVWVALFAIDFEVWGPVITSDVVKLLWGLYYANKPNTMYLGTLYNWFTDFSVVMGQWREKFPRGDYGY